MSKKLQINSDKGINDGITKEYLKEKIVKQNKEIEELKQKITTAESRGELSQIQHQIENNFIIGIENRKELINLILQEYHNKFDDLTNDYTALKQDIEFLTKDINNYSGLSQIAFVLLAKRLQKIRDEKLYLTDGYSDFRHFISDKIKLSRGTIYYYIDIVNYFDVSKRFDTNFEYTKLIPFLPLIKNQEISEKEKEEIKEEAITLAKEKKSYREITYIANDLKTKYGLNQNQEKDIEKRIKKIVSLLPKELSIDNKKELAEYIKNFINKNLNT